MPRREDDEDLLQYMVPGSTLDDIITDDDDDEFDAYFDVVENNKTGTAPMVVASNATQANAQGGATSLAKFQPAQHKNANASVLNRIRIDEFYEGHGGGASGGAKANQRVLNELRDMTISSRFASSQSPKNVDRSERATVENVMDPRTRLILYKLVNTGILFEINGCVSTGKEANVYYAVSGDGSPVALKVFKTSILAFRDRDQYVSGEYRFQRYCKSNPRKMVRTWAEKEARNLSRLQDGGVLAPAVKLLRHHILVMEFLGEDGWPAPRLKEVHFPSHAALDRCYLDLCCTMRKMYARSRLIHGDLSEYNLLLYRGRVVVIDVSQSVESDHPRAMDFLRRDIINVNSFFASQGLANPFTLQELFHFITAASAPSGWRCCTGPQNEQELLTHLKELREWKQQEGEDTIAQSEKAKVDEQVFLNIAVPRTLNEISDRRAPNEEVAPFVEGMIAPGRRQVAGDTAQCAEAPLSEGSSECEQASDDGTAGKEVRNDAVGEKRRNRVPAVESRTLAEMTKEERKEHRKAVKEAQRKRRVTKKKDASRKGKHHKH
ncbi:unnamed protein product [Phytomonas sp. EM1]|nr:unnamed protein product [Phytomonas sp. EM1]|eukprot:CCW59547.1 unnamed protein product [Phytomonas sp. isolate EM1]